MNPEKQQNLSDREAGFDKMTVSFLYYTKTAVIFPEDTPFICEDFSP
jgi:hypothetical protein